MVVRGEKIFTLLPPASAPFLHESHFPSATYRRTTDGQLEAVLDEGDPEPCHSKGLRSYVCMWVVSQVKYVHNNYCIISIDMMRYVICNYIDMFDYIWRLDTFYTL